METTTRYEFNVIQLNNIYRENQVILPIYFKLSYCRWAGVNRLQPVTQLITVSLSIN